MPRTTTVVAAGGRVGSVIVPDSSLACSRRHRTIAQIARIVGVRPKSVAGKTGLGRLARHLRRRPRTDPPPSERWRRTSSTSRSYLKVESDFLKKDLPHRLNTAVEFGPFYQELEGSGGLGFGALFHQIGVFAAWPVSMVKYKIKGRVLRDGSATTAGFMVH